MALLGFDAIGRYALGQVQGGVTNIVMAADAGSFTFAGVAATFKITEAAAAGSFPFSGKAITFSSSLAALKGTFTFAGVAANFKIIENTAPGSFIFTGIDPDEALSEDADPGHFTFTGIDAVLVRTGFDYEFQQGGIGHYRLELERARQLAAITKKVPGLPIDRRTAPRFEPLRGLPVAPPAPAVDMQAAQAERAAQAAAAAAMKRRRRDEEALLLLAC